MEHSLPKKSHTHKLLAFALVWNFFSSFPVKVVETTERLQFPWVEVVEKAQQAVLHLLDVRHVGQEGVLDDRCLSLLLIRFPGRTQVMPGFLPSSSEAEAAVSHKHTHKNAGFNCRCE